MERPYKVKAGKFVGVMAVAMAGFMTLLYIIPASFFSSTYMAGMGSCRNMACVRSVLLLLF